MLRGAERPFPEWIRSWLDIVFLLKLAQLGREEDRREIREKEMYEKKGISI